MEGKSSNVSMVLVSGRSFFCFYSFFCVQSNRKTMIISKIFLGKEIVEYNIIYSHSIECQLQQVPEVRNKNQGNCN
jgi:hypothetical protein